MKNLFGIFKKEKTESRELSVSDIVKLSAKCDIIEIKANIGGKTIMLGSSSECERKGARYEFFNKLYFVGKKEFETIEEFEKELETISPQSIIEVLEIDGVSPYDYNI